MPRSSTIAPLNFHPYLMSNSTQKALQRCLTVVYGLPHKSKRLIHWCGLTGCACSRISGIWVGGA